MGEVSAQIQLSRKNDQLGWTYSRWTIDYGKGQKPATEEVSIKCAETSQRYMSKDDAEEEAKGRIKVKIKQECGDYSVHHIKWEIRESS